MSLTIPFIEDVLRQLTISTGGWIWPILLFLAAGMMWLKTRTFLPPIIIMMFGGGLIGTMIPGAVGAFGYGMTGLGIAIIIYKIFFGRTE